MLIGILSDTHDRVEATIAGLQLLREAGAERFLHCGDVGGEPILDQLAGLKVALVWGNNDWDRRELTRYAERLGIEVFQSLGEFDLGGKRFAMMHGDDPRIIRDVLKRQEHDYLLLGHSHIRADERHGNVRVINPGALHRAKEKSVAVLDTETDELRTILVEGF